MAVLAWYGPYDAHEANSIAKANLTKVEDGALNFAFECVFIEVFFRSTTGASYEDCSGVQARILGVGIRGGQWDLGPIRPRGGAHVGRVRKQKRCRGQSRNGCSRSRKVAFFGIESLKAVVYLAGV